MENEQLQINQKLAAAGIACGIAGIFFFYTILGPICFGALGLTFTILASKGSVFGDRRTKAALILNLISMGIMILVIIYCFAKLRDPEYLAAVNSMFEQMYGSDIESFYSSLINSNSLIA